MKWSKANEVVEMLRRQTQLYLPALTSRKGFSSSRVEHLLNELVWEMPDNECYLEVGTLEGRTLEAAAAGNRSKEVIGCDPCKKYDLEPVQFPTDHNITFIRATWQYVLRNRILRPIGCAFYDGDHSADETQDFMTTVAYHMANEAVLVLDDWDRISVREGAFRADSKWCLLREMPEYTDGLTTSQHHFGYNFGVAVWGFKR